MTRSAADQASQFRLVNGQVSRLAGRRAGCEIRDDGQFDVVWETTGLVLGDEWSDYLPESKDLIGVWRAPLSCGNFNAATGECGGVTN